ncbi:16S rRNA (adenine(1518)-N(6)/adenine(1519)-N(6))-dimethyltransferase RsmA [Desulfobacterales bacterium HSG16]|nr:16S rRNA (adenine(1518)-N(6)/adenine(1519)-N(6))-dimethyltransferase RsmA [Desulfobacterales bacterium HSG16]
MYPKKRLSQNFLADQSITRMIVARSKIAEDDVILEIGAGLGALTIPAARAAKKLYAVEKDARLISLLRTELTAAQVSNVEIMEKNILDIDIVKLADDFEQDSFIVMGNLPYNISSQILIGLIRSRKVVSRAIVMFQKELAKRLVAEPGCKEYGRITAMLRYCSDISILTDVDFRKFYPRPGVDSQVLDIRFKPTDKYMVKDEEFLFKVIKAAFGQRRKTLRNALAGSELKIDTKLSGQVLDECGIDPSRRAETLDVEEFVKLGNYMFSAMETIRSPNILV